MFEDDPRVKIAQSIFHDVSDTHKTARLAQNGLPSKIFEFLSVIICIATGVFLANHGYLSEGVSGMVGGIIGAVIGILFASLLGKLLKWIFILVGILIITALVVKFATHV